MRKGEQKFPLVMKMSLATALPCASHWDTSAVRLDAYDTCIHFICHSLNWMWFGVAGGWRYERESLHILVAWGGPLCFCDYEELRLIFDVQLILTPERLLWFWNRRLVLCSVAFICVCKLWIYLFIWGQCQTGSFSTHGSHLWAVCHLSVLKPWYKSKLQF